MADRNNGDVGDLAVELVDASGLTGLKDEWTRLFDDAESDNPFLTFEWAAATCPHLGDRERPIFGVARRRDRVVGIAPMQITSLRPWGNQLRFLGMEHPGIAGILTHPKDCDTVAVALLEALIRSKEFDRIDFGNIREGAACLKPMREVLSGSGRVEEDTWLPYAYIALENDFDAYLKSRSRNTRGIVSNARNRLQRDGVEARFWRAGAVSEDCLSSMFDIGASRWRPRMGTSMYDRCNMRLFLRDLGDSFSRRGWLDVAGLELNGTLAAFVYGLRIGDVFIYYTVSFDPAYEQYRPGVLLLEHVIRGCYDAGLRKLDFLGGPYPYKLKWATGQGPCRRLRCYLPGFAVRHTLQATVESGREFLKRAKRRSSLLASLWRRVSRPG